MINLGGTQHLACMCTHAEDIMWATQFAAEILLISSCKAFQKYLERPLTNKDTAK
jgi:hypothetical protein